MNITIKRIETEDEIRRYEEAGIRREAKKKLAASLENK